MSKNFPRSIALYTLKRDFRFDMDTIEAALAEFPFVPCLASDARRIGFISPLGGTELCHRLAGDGFIVKIRSQEKIIPPAEVSRLMTERTDLIEKEEGRLVRGTERLQLKCLILEEMRLTAPCTQHDALLMVIPEISLLCVMGVSSGSAADAVTSLFRKAISSLPITIAQPASLSLLKLYNGTISSPAFSLSDLVRLESSSGGKAYFESCDWNEGVNTLLDDGFEVVSIGITLRGFFAFKIDEVGRVTGLKWSSELALKSETEFEAPKSSDSDVYDEAAQKADQAKVVAAADFLLVQAGLTAFVNGFMAACGGYTIYVGYESSEKTEGVSNDTTN